MESDWSVEVGADLPSVIVPWEGFVDLRRSLASLADIPEAAEHRLLAEALIQLNGRTSRVFTSKCDRWLLGPDEIDPLEFDAGQTDAAHGLACYIDLVAREPALYASFSAHEEWVRSASQQLRQVPLRCCRTELVIRAATVEDLDGFAVTLYAAACGGDFPAAQSALADALEAAVAVTIKQIPTMGE